MNTTYSLIIKISIIAASLIGSSISYAQFDNVRWSRDKSNSPRQDKSGSGNTPSTSGATNNQGEFTFRISTSNSSSTQRQEWRFEDRSGYMHMTTEFKIDSGDDNFDKISIAQNHDKQTGSVGVFSIYQVRQSGNNLIFGVQGDTASSGVSNGYSTFSTENIDFDEWYRLRIRSFVDEDDAIEVAELYDSSNRLLWTETIEYGGDDQGYYKIGAYRLTGGKGPVTVHFRNTKFWTGK